MAKTSKANAPAAPKPKKAERKRSKSPRGLKVEKVKNKLLTEVSLFPKRHRNAYNHQMAQVKKLAKML